jgi:alkanesulfonate monooxygenase SsuD/methylene tetrahydromethanopterin reductase-like flavin-dependent oxidoreductase (luciferase family)
MRSVVLASDYFETNQELGRAAERHGFDRVWTTESSGRDAIVRAIAVAQATETIQVGTGIAYAISRAPLSLVATAADAYAATGGRFTLGLGVGTRGQRRWYGADYDHPAPRFAEMVELMRVAERSPGGFDFNGRFYQLSLPRFVTATGLAGQSVPIYGSGLHATMLDYVARSCDGIALHPLAFERQYLETVVLPAVSRGSGRRPSGTPPRIAAWCITAVHEDETTARDWVKRQLSFYFTTPSYTGTLLDPALRAAGERLRDRYREDPKQTWGDLAPLVPDEMVDAYSVAGTPAQVRSRLADVQARLRDIGVEELALQVPGKGMAVDEVLTATHAVLAAAGPR